MSVRFRHLIRPDEHYRAIGTANASDEFDPNYTINSLHIQRHHKGAPQPLSTSPTTFESPLGLGNQISVNMPKTQNHKEKGGNDWWLRMEDFVARIQPRYAVGKPRLEQELQSSRVAPFFKTVVLAKFGRNHGGLRQRSRREETLRDELRREYRDQGDTNVLIVPIDSGNDFVKSFVASLLDAQLTGVGSLTREYSANHVSVDVLWDMAWFFSWEFWLLARCRLQAPRLAKKDPVATLMLPDLEDRAWVMQNLDEDTSSLFNSEDEQSPGPGGVNMSKSSRTKLAKSRKALAVSARPRRVQSRPANNTFGSASSGTQEFPPNRLRRGRKRTLSQRTGADFSETQDREVEEPVTPRPNSGTNRSSVIEVGGDAVEQNVRLQNVAGESDTEGVNTTPTPLFTVPRRMLLWCRLFLEVHTIPDLMAAGVADNTSFPYMLGPVAHLFDVILTRPFGAVTAEEIIRRLRQLRPAWINLSENSEYAANANTFEWFRHLAIIVLTADVDVLMRFCLNGQAVIGSENPKSGPELVNCMLREAYVFTEVSWPEFVPQDGSQR